MDGDGQYPQVPRPYYAQHGVHPSYATFEPLVGMSSRAIAAEMVERLKRASFSGRTPDRRGQAGRRFHDREVRDYVRTGPTSIPCTSMLTRLTSTISSNGMGEAPPPRTASTNAFAHAACPLS